jgi:GAF domain-containing protein
MSTSGQRDISVGDSRREPETGESMEESSSHLMRFLQQENVRLQAENKTLREENQALVNYLRLLEDLHAAAQEIGSEDDLLRLVDGILFHAMHLTKSSDGSVLLLDADTNELVFAVVHGDIEGQLRGYRIPADTGIAGWVAAMHEPVIANNAPQDWRFSPIVDEVFKFTTRSLVCVPMVTRHKLVGVIEVLNRQSGESYTEADVNLLLILGNVAANALETMRKRLDAQEEVAVARPLR